MNQLNIVYYKPRKQQGMKTLFSLHWQNSIMPTKRTKTQFQGIVNCCYVGNEKLVVSILWQESAWLMHRLAIMKMLWVIWNKLSQKQCRQTHVSNSAFYIKKMLAKRMLLRYLMIYQKLIPNIRQFILYLGKLMKVNKILNRLIGHIKLAYLKMKPIHVYIVQLVRQLNKQEISMPLKLIISKHWWLMMKT